MKLAHLTTFWPITGGLSHYTNDLIFGMRASRDVRHLVLGQEGSDRVQTEAYACVPCYRRDRDYVEDVTKAAKENEVDVLVIQYAPDLFGDDNRLPRLVASLRAVGVRPVVNMHSIYPEHWRTGFRPERTVGAFDRAIGQQASLITVHSARMKADLVSHGLSPEGIAVIPHGTPTMPKPDQAECRAALGLPQDSKLVLFFGYIWVGKGLEFLLNVFRDVSRQIPNAVLLVAGHTRRRLWASYVTYLRLRSRLLGLGARSHFWGGYVPEQKVAQVFGAADVVAMPYLQDYSSVSGVVHQTAAMGKLMLCSRIPKFDEVEAIDPALVAGQKNRGEWSQAMSRLLRDDELAARLRAKVDEFAVRTHWNNVGKLHWEHYDRLMERRA